LGESIGVILMQKTEVQTIPETHFNLSEAAQKYLEQYGDPIVTNTYLKLTILVLALVSSGTLTLFYRAQMALSTMKPLVIRINDIGRAEAVDYQNFAYKPQQAENRYFLAEWAQAYYSRNHYTIHKDLTKALYFLNGDLQNAILEKYKKEKVVDSFLLDPSQPNIDIQVKNVTIEDLRQPPYKARIEFYKIFTSPLDHIEQKRELWIANAVYTFRDQVRNEMLPVNPLGLTITYFREDQAFRE
jgi:type IV secretory pathway TrbF-like protein